MTVIPFPRRRRYGTHPAGRALTNPTPPVQVVNGRVWAQGASVADVEAALAGWMELARLNSSPPPAAAPAPRGDVS